MFFFLLLLLRSSVIRQVHFCLSRWRRQGLPFANGSRSFKARDFRCGVPSYEKSELHGAEPEATPAFRGANLLI